MSTVFARSVLAVYSTLAIACGPATAGDSCPDVREGSRPVGGSEVAAGNRAYTAFVQYRRYQGDNEPPRCAGTLIAKDKVLTAAHCIWPGNLDEPRPKENFAVRLGSVDAFSGGEEFGVANVFIAPNFDHKKLENDLAVLQLDGESKVDPIELDGIGRRKFRDADLRTPEGIALGWGHVDAARSTFPRILVKVAVPVVPTCEIPFGLEDYGKIGDRRLCAGGKAGIDTCNGDSGGPLIVGERQVGVTSYGADECGKEGFFGIYTRVSAFAEFLTAHVKTVGTGRRASSLVKPAVEVASLGDRSTRLAAMSPGASPGRPQKVFLIGRSWAPVTIIPGVVEVSSATEADFVWDATTGEVKRRASSAAVVAQGVTNVGKLDDVLSKWHVHAEITALPVAKGLSVSFANVPANGALRRGQPFEIVVGKPDDAAFKYMTLIDLASHGTVSGLYPVPEDGDGGFGKTTTSVELPGVCPPFGVDHFIAIATADKPERLRATLKRMTDRAEYGFSSAFSLLEALKAEAASRYAVAIAEKQTAQ